MFTNPVAALETEAWTLVGARRSGSVWQPNGNEFTGRTQGFVSFASPTDSNEISRLFDDLVVGQFYGLTINLYGGLDRRSPPFDGGLNFTVGDPSTSTSVTESYAGERRPPQVLRFRATSSCTVITIAASSATSTVFVGPMMFGPVSAPSECALSNPRAFPT